jgi:hypothetical protein
MSTSVFFDPLLLLLDDPALLDALLAGADPDLAAAVPGAATPGAEPPVTAPPDDAPQTIEDLEAALAAIEAAARAALADAFGLDPDLLSDVDALITAIAGLEQPPGDDAPEAVSGEASWDLSSAEAVREDWALG